MTRCKSPSLFFWAWCLLCPWLLGQAKAQDRLVDDSYSPAERLARYQGANPELRLPVLRFSQGQQVLFERPYRQLGQRQLRLDLFKAVSAKAANPGIVLVHGGGWRAGDKSHFYALANLLAQRGYVVVLPQYRLSIEAPYPAGLEDVNQAILWAKAHAKDIGLDPSRLALGGGSSGGQMAALLANTAHLPLFKPQGQGDTQVMALVDLDGVLDLTSPLALAHENKNGNRSAAALWLGGSFEAVPQRWRQASAVSHLSAQSPPALVISSGQGRFTAGKEAFFNGLDRFGVAHRYLELDTVHPFWLFDPYLDQVAKAVDDFLRQQGQGEAN